MNFLIITSDGMPLYLKNGLPGEYKGPCLNGKASGDSGASGLIVLQERKSDTYIGRFHFFKLLKNILIHHIFPEGFLQALVAMNEDILYHIEGYGNLLLKKGQYMLVPYPYTEKAIEAKLGKDKEYRIFEAIYTLDDIKSFATLFPHLKKLLFDKNGKWVPEAREAGEKALDTIREMFIYPYTEKNWEDYFYIEHLKRFYFLLIAQAAASPDPKLSSDIDAAYKARDIILSNPAKDPNLKDISKRLYIPIHRLKESFRKLFSNNPAGFIREHRMEMAWRMITETDKPVKVIAAELGFKKPQSFATKFKRRYGTTPLDARNNIRKGIYEKI